MVVVWQLPPSLEAGASLERSEVGLDDFGVDGFPDFRLLGRYL